MMEEIYDTVPPLAAAPATDANALRPIPDAVEAFLEFLDLLQNNGLDHTITLARFPAIGEIKIHTSLPSLAVTDAN